MLVTLGGVKLPASRPLPLAAAAVGALVLAASALAAAPVSGSISGPVTAVTGGVFKVKTSLSPTGTSAVHVASSTVLTEQATGSRSDLKTGACATAVGQRGAKGAVTAMRVMLTQPVKGSCTAGFGGRRPGGAGQPGSGQTGAGRPTQPPGNGSQEQRPPGGNGFANFGFASGAISAVKGSTFTVHSSRTGTATVTVDAKTQFTKTVRVAASAIKTKLCAFVFGTSSDKGVTVEAQSVGLSQPTGSTCGARFRRP